MDFFLIKLKQNNCFLGGIVSRQSGRVTFPQSAKSISSSKSALQVIDDEDPENNPFKVPPDQDIFMLRDKERQRKKEVMAVYTNLTLCCCSLKCFIYFLQEREKQRKLRVHEKTTYASRVNAKTASMRKAALGSDELLDDSAPDLALKDDPGWTLAVTRGRWLNKKVITSYSICIDFD